MKQIIMVNLKYFLLFIYFIDINDSTISNNSNIRLDIMKIDTLIPFEFIIYLNKINQNEHFPKIVYNNNNQNIFVVWLSENEKYLNISGTTSSTTSNTKLLNYSETIQIRGNIICINNNTSKYLLIFWFYISYVLGSNFNTATIAILASVLSMIGVGLIGGIIYLYKKKIKNRKSSYNFKNMSDEI